VLVSIDGIVVGFRSHAALGLLVRYVLLGFGIGAWAAALSVLLVTPGHLMDRTFSAVVKNHWAQAMARGFGYALLALAGGAVLLRPWELAGDTRTYRPIFALTLMVVVMALALSALWDRAKKTAVGIALVVAASCELADALILVSVYPRWHDAAGFFALIMASVAASGLLALQPRRLRLAISASALLLQLSWFVSARAVVELGAEQGIVVPKLLAAARWFTDWDGDRFSNLLGGGDCNDDNAQVFPGQCETASNGVDENCNGLDGAQAVSLPTEPGVARSPLPDVYFVLLDGTRADFAGAPRAQIAPEIDQFAQGALEFRHAYTTYPSTFRAIVTLLASRHWRYLGAGDELFCLTLAHSGWDTKLFIRDQAFANFSNILKLTRKEDPFHTRSSGKESWTKTVIDSAIAEIARNDGPARLRWLHLLDTHAPWVHGDGAASEQQQYRAEIAHSSKHFGRLVEALQATERGQRAVVILLADHGAALGEHGAGTHGGTLYEELVRVPLLVRLPGVAPRSIDGVASLLDIVPTLAHYLGVPANPAWQGFNWLTCQALGCEVAERGPLPRLVAQLQASAAWGYAGLPALNAVSDGRYKLLVDLDRGRRMFFDLHKDPAESKPVVEPPSDALQALEETLASWEDLSGCANRL